MLFGDEVWEMYVGRFHIDCDTGSSIMADIDCEWAPSLTVKWDEVLGERIFLTREGAEKKRKERKENEQ